MMKSLLLAGAAGLASVSLSQAADVPMDKAEAVEYVKVCSEFGAGFFYIPGTDTCLKIGGRVRATYAHTDSSAAVDDTESNVDFSSNAMLSFDARTATELGQLRSFIEVSAGEGSSLSVGKAFIQLGGLTAGYAASMFDSGIGVGDAVIGTAWASDETTNLLAYTASFGGGFYATLSIEDGVTRRNSVRGYSVSVDASGVVVGAGGTNVVLTSISPAYAGSDMPDFVVALGASDQSWGAFKVMGAIHQISYQDATAGTVTGVPVGDEFGYALGAAAELKAAGFTFGLQGNYADGAIGYLDDDSPDAVVYRGNGATAAWVSEKSSGYALSSSVGFSLSPTLSATVYGSYKNIDWGTPGTILADLAGDPSTSSGPKNQESYAFGVNATYVVTPGLKVIAAAAYQQTETTSAVGGDTVVDKKTKTDTTDFAIRLQREF